MKHFKPFHAAGIFLYPLETLENQRFSDVVRGYRKRPVARNGSYQTKILSTIIPIVLWDFLMFYQILLSPQVKRCAIIIYKHGYTQVAPRSPVEYGKIRTRNNSTPGHPPRRAKTQDPRKLGNIRKVSKHHRMIASAQSPY